MLLTALILAAILICAASVWLFAACMISGRESEARPKRSSIQSRD